jgi:hypothetical protein
MHGSALSADAGRAGRMVRLCQRQVKRPADVAEMEAPTGDGAERQHAPAAESRLLRGYPSIRNTAPVSNSAAPVPPPRPRASHSSQRRAPFPANCGGNAQTRADPDENTAEERRSHAACGPTWRAILTATPRPTECRTPPTAPYRPRREQNHLDVSANIRASVNVGWPTGALARRARRRSSRLQ